MICPSLNQSQRQGDCEFPEWLSSRPIRAHPSYGSTYQTPAGATQWEKGMVDVGEATTVSAPRSFSFPGWKTQALARILHGQDPWAFPGLAAFPALSPLGANPCNRARLCPYQNPGYQEHWLTLTMAFTVSCLGVTRDKPPFALVGSDFCSATSWMHNPQQVTLLPSPSVFSSVKAIVRVSQCS